MGLPRHRVEATADDGMVVVTLPRPRLRSVSPPLMAAVAVVLVATGSAALPDGGDKTVREASVPEQLTHPVVVALDDAVPASWSHELLTDVAPPPAPATGTRAVDVARLAGQGIPEVALAAYRAAAASLAQADPGCHLDWALLAGIGRVESFHGRFGGSSAGTDGVVSPPIIGVPLDGGPGIATITDTDDGSLDGDTVHDRAVGPMQFIPGTWAGFGVDGDGDGRADPQNLFDAALSAGTYLCAGEGD